MVAVAAVFATGAALPATFVFVTAAEGSFSGSSAGLTLHSSGWVSLPSPLAKLLYPRANNRFQIFGYMEEVYFLKPNCSIRFRRS